MVEAMLCGRPVVATNVAGHSEIVEDGVTGFLADALLLQA
jgi:glycosyltransferase involved in cell wall biosynthesis